MGMRRLVSHSVEYRRRPLCVSLKKLITRIEEIYFKPRMALVEIDFFESQSLQQTGNRRGGILLSRSQDSVRQGGGLQLTFSLLPNLGFQIRVGGHQQPGLPRIYACLLAVEPGAEHLRCGKMQANFLAVHPDIARL